MSQPTAIQLLHWQAAVELGGGIWRGVQRGDSSIGLDDLVLFDDAGVPAKQRSTMAIQPDKLSADAVRVLIKNKRAEYEQQYIEFAEKAARFVFRSFSGQQPTIKRSKEEVAE